MAGLRTWPLSSHISQARPGATSPAPRWSSTAGPTLDDAIQPGRGQRRRTASGGDHMIERLDPTRVHAPLGGYCHTIKAPSGSELGFVDGQVGTDREGLFADGARAQTRQALANVATCLFAQRPSVA